MTTSTSTTTTTTTTITTTRTNGTQACAACKYQRRKCAPDCILAPYFPHDRQRQFLNAHKLFGVSNITKIIRSLPRRSDKDEAMRTIVFQSDVRAADPVGGCYRIIIDLQRQIDYGRAELELVLHQLAICQAQAAAAAAGAAAQHQVVPFSEDEQDPLSGYDLVAGYDYQIQPQPQDDHDHPHHHHHHYRRDEEEEYFVHEDHDRSNNVHHHGHADMMPLQEEMATWAIQDTASSALNEKQRCFTNGECGGDGDGDFKPTILDLGEERLELKFDHDDDDDEEEEDDKSGEESFKKEGTVSKEETVSLIDKDVSKQEMGLVGEARDRDDLKSSAASFFALAKCNG